MAITNYSKASIITAYFTAIAQATKIVLCSTASNPTWTVAQANTDKLAEATMTISAGNIGGDYSAVTSGGFPALRVAQKSMTATVTGTGKCLVFHDGTDVLKAIPIADFPVVAGSVSNLLTFDMLFK